MVEEGGNKRRPDDRMKQNVVASGENWSKGLLLSAHFASGHKRSLTIRARNWASPRLRGDKEMTFV